MKERIRIALRSLLLIVYIVLTSGCEGDGTGGEGLLIRSRPPGECGSVAGLFPSGMALLTPTNGLAAVVQFDPPSIAAYRYDIGSDHPIVQTAVTNISVDSDGDGLDDQVASVPLFPCRARCESRTGGVIPVVGALKAITDDLALLSTSGYEQILLFNPSTTAAIEILVEVPATIPPSRHPMLPAPGTSALRRGISTFTCIEPPDPFYSNDSPILPDSRCNPNSASYLTSFTAGSVIADGRLFVATSNYDVREDAYHPGTVLAYEWIENSGDITVRPLEDDAVLFTTRFNPTGLTRHTTQNGRELVLVTLTGSIQGISSPDSARTEAAIDVIDPSGPRIVATIPLGLAAPAFESIAIDPSGRIAWIGSATAKQLYGVDLRVLNNPQLYLGSGPPIILDGLTVGFSDARIFSAETPFTLPIRIDRPSNADCSGLTNVATNNAGTEAFAIDFCDGTLTRVGFDLSGNPPIPFPSDRFQILDQTAPFAPVPSPDELTAAGFIAVRPGTPGVDYDSPDVFVLVGDPGLICPIRVESL